jgi:hypothetical protein
MLFKQRFLEGLAAGTITLAFRRWRRPHVRPGTQLRTPVGVLAVEAVDEVAVERISDAEARRAGFAARTDLMAALGTGDAPIYRVALRHAGADPRIALRQRAALSADELEEIRRRLARLDKSSRRGPWTAAMLRLIAERPAVRAADLAASVGRETLPFKADVRKLKELGLTESLEVGYHLSPRGRAVCARLR